MNTYSFRYGYHVSNNSYYICNDPLLIEKIFNRLRNYEGTGKVGSTPSLPCHTPSLKPSVDTSRCIVFVSLLTDTSLLQKKQDHYLEWPESNFVQAMQDHSNEHSNVLMFLKGFKPGFAFQDKFWLLTVFKNTWKLSTRIASGTLS